MSFLIELQHVTKAYPLGENKVMALKGVDFHVERGEMTAIVGASGSGKSTLLNIIGFLDHCTSGRYFFEGQDVSHLAEHQWAEIRNQKVGFVFQSFFLLPRSTALQNVMLPLFYRDLPRSIIVERAMATLEKVGVAHLANNRPQHMSGGQQQRVAIARALVGEPRIILADEPTGALDSQTGNEVMALFDDLNQKEGRTILIITHDREISKRCPRTVAIKDGTMAG